MKTVNKIGLVVIAAVIVSLLSIQFLLQLLRLLFIDVDMLPAVAVIFVVIVTTVVVIIIVTAVIFFLLLSEW